MPDEFDMLEDAEFELIIDDMGNDLVKLSKFNARQQFKTNKVLIDYGQRIKKLEGQNKKALGFVGATGAILATAIIEAFNYLLGRPS